MADAYRADQVGSFLRPADVKEGRSAFNEGRINRDQLTEIEDAAILGAIERQRQSGIDIFSDGEYRRASFQNDLADSVMGTANPKVHLWSGYGKAGATTSPSSRTQHRS